MDVYNDSTNDSDISMASNITMLNSSAIKAKIISGEIRVINKRGRSKVWDIFGPIECENGDQIPNLVACRKCFSVFKFNFKSTSNLVKHRCYLLLKRESSEIGRKIEVDTEDKQISVRVVTQWTVENCRPFKIVEDTGLRNFAQFLISIGARYGENVDIEKLLPHPTTISRNIQNLYTKYIQIIRNEIAPVRKIGYGLTSDIWTDNYMRTSYISLTIHYISEGRLITRLLGLRSMKGESCTGKNIMLKTSNILNEFEFELNDKAIMVTDRGANMVAAFRQLNQVFCINHLIHNAIDKGVKEIHEIAELSIMCAKLVKYFKKSGTNSSLKTSLKGYSCTRWNTIFYLFDSIEKNWAEITNILREKNELQRINNINLNYVSALIRILKAFEETSKKLEGEDYPTLHLTIVHIHRLKKICAVNIEDLSVIKDFKLKLSNFLDYTVLQNLTIFHRIALFLFPPANKLIQFNEEEQKCIKDECKVIMEKYANEMTDQEDQNRLLNEELGSLLSDDKDLFQDFIPPVELMNSSDKVNNELCTYENTNVIFYDDFNVIQWWLLHQIEFPLLYKVSCKILSTPASSASSERIFSSARQLITEKRSLIGSDPMLVNQIMFLHSNVKKNDIHKDLEENTNIF